MVAGEPGARPGDLATGEEAVVQHLGASARHRGGVVVRRRARAVEALGPRPAEVDQGSQPPRATSCSAPPAAWKAPACLDLGVGGDRLLRALRNASGAGEACVAAASASRRAAPARRTRRFFLFIAGMSLVWSRHALTHPATRSGPGITWLACMMPKPILADRSNAHLAYLDRSQSCFRSRREDASAGATRRFADNGALHCMPRCRPLRPSPATPPARSRSSWRRARFTFRLGGDAVRECSRRGGPAGAGGARTPRPHDGRSRATGGACSTTRRARPIA